MTTGWIETLAATFAVVLLAMAALGVGLLFGRSGPEGGTCGRFKNGACVCVPGRPACDAAGTTEDGGATP